MCIFICLVDMVATCCIGVLQREPIAYYYSICETGPCNYVGRRPVSSALCSWQADPGPWLCSSRMFRGQKETLWVGRIGVLAPGYSIESVSLYSGSFFSSLLHLVRWGSSISTLLGLPIQILMFSRNPLTIWHDLMSRHPVVQLTRSEIIQVLISSGYLAASGQICSGYCFSSLFQTALPEAVCRLASTWHAS